MTSPANSVVECIAASAREIAECERRDEIADPAFPPPRARRSARTVAGEPAQPWPIAAAASHSSGKCWSHRKVPSSPSLPFFFSFFSPPFFFLLPPSLPFPPLSLLSPSPPPPFPSPPFPPSPPLLFFFLLSPLSLNFFVCGQPNGSRVRCQQERPHDKQRGAEQQQRPYQPRPGVVVLAHGAPASFDE